MSKKSDGYEMNEKDIDTVLRILKQKNPGATPEDAIEVLEKMQAGVHLLGHLDPQALEEMYKELQKEKRVKN